ncbi:hypothetical protein [Methylobacterium sp. 22177]|uniref:hypothetical protein n=1 Tax=Methylobacterium sp. 22177 TaxID=3453885 RepID=UPI003F841380
MRDWIKNGITHTQPLRPRPEGRGLNHAVVIFALAALLAAPIAAGCGSYALAQAPQSGRSSFGYVDGKVVDDRHYRAPKVDADPTDLSLEELRARVSALEERMERLDAFLLSQQAAQAEMEERAKRAISSSRGGKP